MEIGPGDWKNIVLLLSAPVFITVCCIIAKGKERWLFMFGVIFFGVILVVLIARR